jgi:hypothetical protein
MGQHPLSFSDFGYCVFPFFSILRFRLYVRPAQADCLVFPCSLLRFFSSCRGVCPFSFFLPVDVLVLVLQCCHLPFLTYVQSNSISFVLLWFLLVLVLFCSTIRWLFCLATVSLVSSLVILKVCNLCVVSLLTFQVSAPYSNTLLIVRLNILTFVSLETTFVFHMSPSWLNICLAFPIPFYYCS